MNKTNIEWVKNPDGSQGYTWNPLTGCLNHVEGKCKGGGFLCYAYRLANTRLRERYLANQNVAPAVQATNVSSPIYSSIALIDPFYPRFWPERLYHSWRGEPRGIFTCDMSDLFGIGIPEDWTQKVLDLVRLHSANRYYLLTKQPQNLIKWSPFPANCWVGVTATNTRMALDACLALNDIEAPVTYLSLEPMLNSINLPSKYLIDMGIKWLIIGAQTKPYKPPDIEWVREIVDAADEAGIRVFLKDNFIRNLSARILMNPYMNWAKRNNAPRQEMPV